ncbi:auxin-responsive protein SAUR32-like [Phoenix dactylifera]|uniref:Auxin-responsive protein SAUR32-like n=1 Tax=Phoenix dactylifera TaxID=42345 RepID=A0A8B9AAX6_PHODC|nr:auxin-responsive protein SAUR32-like [Phoenix dactylifera]
MRPVDKQYHLDRPLNFYSHTRHDKGPPLKPPKGWMGIRVGTEGEEEKQRFVVPVEYLKHPLFVGLLKEAEREYGFDQLGAITIPCRVEHFRYVRGIIDREHSAAVQAHRQHYHRSRRHHRLAHFSGCFRA